MTKLACAFCGPVLGGDLRRPAKALAQGGPDRSTVPRGWYAIDPEPFGAGGDPKEINQWIAETKAERLRAEAELRRWENDRR